MKGIGQKGIGFQELMPIAMTLVIIGVAVGIGIQANEQMLDVTMPGAVVVANETLTSPLNGSYQTLNYQFIKGVLAVYNCSLNGQAGNAQLVIQNTGLTTARNYSFDEELGLWLNYSLTDLGQVNDINVTYLAINTSTSQGRNIYITKNASAGISQLAQWTPTIALVISAGLVVGVISMWFLRREEY